jgi:hypothetical protein
VTADSALQTLDVSYCQLGDDGMRPLFAAVAYSTRLCELSCSDNGISLEFARDVVLPAIRSNISLRRLKIAFNLMSITVLREAEALVAERGQA